LRRNDFVEVERRVLLGFLQRVRRGETRAVAPVTARDVRASFTDGDSAGSTPRNP